MELSSAGKKKMLAFAFIIGIDIAVLALSVSVNIFQEFFFMADLFPLVLSIVTLTILLLHIIVDLTSKNAFIARPVVEIPLLGTLTIVWLAFNSFSTSRYAGLPDCSVFPDDLPDERAWCRNTQGLRAVIWIEWAALLITTLTLIRISIAQAHRGNTADASSFYRGSSIFGFDRVNGHQDSSMAPRDWFAPAKPAIQLNNKVDGQRYSAASSFFAAGRAGLGAYGNEVQSTVPLRQQFQTPSPTRGPAVITVDGFEIVSTGYYSQNGGNWN